MKNFITAFAKDEDGAQVVEYALIIAVVSLTLIVALQKLDGTDFGKFVTRVGTCLSGSAACA